MDKNVGVAMRDGTVLRADVYLPDDASGPLVEHVVHRHRRPLGREGAGHAGAHPLAGAGDEGDPAGQVEHQPVLPGAASRAALQTATTSSTVTRAASRAMVLRMTSSAYSVGTPATASVTTATW